MQLTKDNYKEELASGEHVVYFYSKDCAPCRAFLEESDFPLKVAAVEECMDWAIELRVMVSPVILLYRNGELVKRHDGSLGKEQLAEWAIS